MGTDLRDVPNIDRNISMKRSAGGDTYGGVTVHVLTNNPERNDSGNLSDMFQSIRLTREQALALGRELVLFGEGNEVEYY
jgi:hypothetical protein|tara:strand:+ start:996 stop:1235 length:240 start_codon:yes stop_codon:yes gene_type:complete